MNLKPLCLCVCARVLCVVAGIVDPHLWKVFSVAIDRSVPEDHRLIAFIPKLACTIREPGECVYVHCWGGHGRTGIVIATLLIVLYGVTPDEALHLTEAYHSKREEARSHSPQTSFQFKQVKRVSPFLKQWTINVSIFTGFKFMQWTKCICD